MTRVAYVDAVGGAGGDMLLAALLDAGASLPAVREAVESVLPGRFIISTQPVQRAGLHATLLRPTPSTDRPRVAAPPPRPFRELIGIVERARLASPILARVQSILHRLAQAEARVHGVDLSTLTMHELGSDDTLLDVVGVAAALQELGVEKVLVSSLPLAVGGTVPGPHGPLPLPAPATLELLRGFIIRGETDGELVTPTAAAIFAALGMPSAQPPAMTLQGTGYGAGTRDRAGRPNVVRILLGTLMPGATLREHDLSLLETNLDDFSPELVADAGEALREAGALDVWTTPAHMKKNRSGVVLAALCEPTREAALRKVFFEATSTFGVRIHTVRRTALERKLVHVPLSEGSVRVKLGLLDGQLMSATPEHGDVAALARRTARPVRIVYEEAVAAAFGLRDRAVDA